MNENDPKDDLRDINGTDDSIYDQIFLLHFLIWAGITTRQDAVTKGPIQDLLDEHGVELEHTLDTVIGNLFVADFLDRYYPEQGADAILVCERTGEVVFDTWEEELLVDQAALIDHINEQDETVTLSAWTDGGIVTIRHVLADEFEIDPDKVEVALREGDTQVQRQKLNDAVDAIEEHDELTTRDTYDKIDWRHKGYRYWVPERIASEAIESEAVE